MVFKGVEDTCDVCCYLTRFHFSLWTLISKTFCDSFIGNILPSWFSFV